VSGQGNGYPDIFTKKSGSPLASLTRSRAATRIMNAIQRCRRAGATSCSRHVPPPRTGERARWEADGRASGSAGHPISSPLRVCQRCELLEGKEAPSAPDLDRLVYQVAQTMQSGSACY